MNIETLKEHYYKFSLWNKYIVYERSEFGAFISFTILLAGILVGLQTYPSLEEDPIINILDWIILGIFSLEVIVKVFSEGFKPWLYWIGPEWRWNNFDFLIVVLCLPIWGNMFGGSSVSLLRLIRLMRLLKLVRQIPQLQMIIGGLIGGLQSIGYILLLLFLVIYLFAVSGMFVFGKNDPWHFGSLPRAMITLLQVSTMDNWSGVMYINMYGCDKYRDFYWSDDTTSHGFNDYHCTHPEAHPVISPLYWIFFVILSGLVMLSLFIGAVTMAMAESMSEITGDVERAQKEKAKEQNMNRMAIHKVSDDDDDDDEYDEYDNDDSLEKKLSLSNRSRTARSILELKDCHDSFEALQKRLGLIESEDEIKEGLQKMSGIVGNIWEGIDLTQISNVDRENRDRTMELVKDKSWFVRQYFRLSLYCDRLVENQYFANFITFTILAAGILVGIQTDEDIEQEHGDLLDLLDLVILIIFTIEIGLKFIAAFDRPLKVFRSRWNVFDFFIVVSSFMLGGGMVSMLRLLRLLRVLKLVKAFKQLQVIVNALMMGFNSIGFISIIMLWSFYLFGVLGVILFRDTDPWHFGTLHMAMYTLFHSATLENWSVVMYINLYGCKKYGYEDDEMQDLCKNSVEPAGFVSVLYFFVFVIISAMVLLTLFIGVVTMAMDQSQQQQEKEDKIERQIERIAQAEELDEHEVTIYKDVFRILDLDEGGTIDMEELEMGLEMLGQPRDKTELEIMMDIIDEDGTGEINVAEFVNFMAHMKKAADIDEDDLLKQVETTSSFSKEGSADLSKFINSEEKKEEKEEEEEEKEEEEEA